ncbi:heptosyltransferase-1 [Solimonas aquatica]|uniref:Heptosyltransferase-1 n=1 Tax=Solimonas aquatica TaxID=489703 RepID=A0A1H9CMD4_9GAMM|nr:glycosyltransferase family 9 protein [Solimonas aquatica]SEQ02376.1 heptosyltransferase-1 [Solimonas aquatica]
MSQATTALTLPPPADPQAPRILVVRVSALGDIVFASSLLDGLRRRWPRARIHWLAQAGLAGILREDPRVDEVITLTPQTLKSPAALWRLRRQLRARRYDYVLEAQGLFKSRLLAALAGGTRIGFASKEPGSFLIHHLLPKGGEIRDISSEYRYLAQRLTGEYAGPPRLQPSAAQRDSVQARARALGLAGGFIAFCPFTTRPQKHWFESRWAELAGALAQQGETRPIALFGGPGDAEAAARILAAAAVPIVNLVGQTKVAELPAWLAQAQLVIGVDTGLTHIGIAVQTPTVALFGSTCPYLQLGSAGEEARLRVLYEALPCSPCRRSPTCEGRYDCMRQLTVDRVTSAAAGLLRAAPGR